MLCYTLCLINITLKLTYLCILYPFQIEVVPIKKHAMVPNKSKTFISLTRMLIHKCLSCNLIFAIVI